ncbi:MAG: class I SAM-dependent methyltransferase [Nanoarchaeota archaeon]
MKEEFFSGEKLYGDDFNVSKIKEWYNDEKEGYSGIVKKRIKKYSYQFHEFNKKYGFSKLNNITKFPRVLGFGAAYGDEFLPIINKIKQVYIVEPSDKLRAKKIGDKTPVYVKSSIQGKLPFENNYFDLITCLGVIHHVPNVSFVFSELVRVLNKGGYLLIREPTVSMGDWNKPRHGLTKRERGIPLGIMHELIKSNGLEIVAENRILFPLTRRLAGNTEGTNSKLLVFLDGLMSRLFSWNKKYHARRIIDKLQPQSVYLVLRKK